uniref:Uncharacterized protein n=1 Tax=Oryza punctata TaxID=4537 RepID=A0A0E0MB76_ORYPU
MLLLYIFSLQAEIALSELIQSSPEEALHPLSKSLVKITLLNHKKRMSNFSFQFAFIEVLAPDPPFSDEIFKALYAFAELAETNSPYLPRRILLLENVAALRVRIVARDAAKACYMAVTSGNETKDILTSLEERLLDFDAAEKPQTVVISCYCRPQNMELILAEELFPSSLSPKEKAKPLG